MLKTIITAGLLCAGVMLLVQDDVTAGGNGGTICFETLGPDVIVGDVTGISNYSAVGGIEAYSFGTESCNIGTEELLWNSSSPNKPVIGQTVFRLRDGRFEQLGQGWLKHGFYALSDNLCGCGCSGTDGSMLGVGCSDLYSSGLNGQQSNMGPKYEVNAFTGVYPYPPTNGSSTGDGIYKRVQIKISDIDPAQDGDNSQFFVEGQYVSPDDAAAGNSDNNSSYREMSVSGSGSSWNFSYVGSTVREQQAMYAWAANDPEVQVYPVRVHNEGLVLLGSKVTDLGGGLYDYEFAIQNFTSDRSIGSVIVPITEGAQVSNIGFHDVDYHSGSPIDGTDWTGSVGGGYVIWECPEEYDDNIWANAIRWGTLYNFRFRANVTPNFELMDLGIFKPPSGDSTSMVAQGRAYLPTGDVQFVDCNDNGVADDEDISNGTSNDCNTNGLPDECETDLECPPDLSIELVGDAPAVIDPMGGTEVVVQVEELLGTLSGVSLDYTADGTPGSVAFSAIGGNQYSASFPSFACETQVTWSAKASSNEGNDYSTDEYNSVATVYIVVFEDDGETNAGWTVGCEATDGCWDRGIPAGGGDRGDPPSDCDGSGSCWLTDNVDGNSDVDGGATTLTSPMLDANVPGAVLSYCRWYSNDFGAAPNEDVFVVEVSDDGGSNWVVVETVGPTGPGTGGGWYTSEFVLSDIPGIKPSEQFLVRFTVSDEGSGSVIEAGVDAIMISASDCEDVSCPEDVTGDLLVSVEDLLAVIGEWNCTGSCAADINGDGTVNVADLLMVIAAWGSCA